ncbi:MAG: hypothetical protein AB7U64_23405 [Blastocatellales bacterium]
MEQFSKESIALMKTALADKLDSAVLAKAGINIASGLTAYDLRAPALLHVPQLTPIRNMMPRNGRTNPGDAAHWKQIRSLTGSGFDGMGYVPEGQRSGSMGVSTIPKSANYLTLGEESSVTFEAEAAAEGFEDANAFARWMALKKVMQKEENAILFGNRNIQLGTVGTVTTASPTDAASTMTATTYYVSCVALTAEGYRNSSVAGGVATSMSVTGADGQTYTVNGGSSNKSAIASEAVSSGDGLSGSVTPIQGAVAYAWYVGTSNSASALHLQQITTINSFYMNADPVTSTQAASAITADCSYNDGTQAGTNPVAAFDGLMTAALVSGSGAYYLALATGTAGTGTALTANNAGGVEEIDEMLLTMWDRDRLSVDNLWMSARTARALFKLILTNASAPLLRFNKDADAGGLNISGGGTIDAYFSPISTVGGTKIPIRVHPNLPDGVILGQSTQLPAFYENNSTPVVAEVLTRRDYYSIDWPLRTRAREFGVYTDEVLAVYAPFAMGVIANIAV